MWRSLIWPRFGGVVNCEVAAGALGVVGERLTSIEDVDNAIGAYSAPKALGYAHVRSESMDNWRTALRPTTVSYTLVPLG
jgi:hypothetical protein